MSISDEEYQTMKENARRKGRTLITFGLLIVVVGLAILIWGFTAISFDISDPGSFDTSFIWKVAVGGGLAAIGIMPFAIGMYFYMASKMDKIAKFYSRATGGAMKYSTENVADGFASGLSKHGMSIGGGKEVVKIKCRNCGYLETEDAEFCSKCGQTM
jgi:hypothetical protein